MTKHLCTSSKLLVYPNQVIAGSDRFGGNTGHSYGSHLHLNTIFDVPFDPEELLMLKKQIKTDNLFVHKSFLTRFHKSKATFKSLVVAIENIIRLGWDTFSAIAARHHTCFKNL